MISRAKNGPHETRNGLLLRSDLRVPRTDYLVAKVKITLNLAAVPDWKQIDAVQLVAARD